MIWKIFFLSFVLCVLGNEHSGHRIKIIHKGKSDKSIVTYIGSNEKDGHYGSLSHIGPKKPEHHEQYAWAYPSYKFSYDVYDPHTHDIKGQKESRDGDKVKGEYWLIQPDGLKRTVKYHADKHSGFHADVHYSDGKHKYEDKYKYEEDKEKEDADVKETVNNEGKDEESNEGHEYVYNKKSDEAETKHEHEGYEEENKSEDEASSKEVEKEEKKDTSEEEKDEDSSEEKEDKKEDKKKGQEELGEWIHNRHWGYRNDKNRLKNKFNVHYHYKYSNEHPKHKERKHKAEHKKTYSYPVISKLGYYGNRKEHDYEGSYNVPVYHILQEPLAYSEQKN